MAMKLFPKKLKRPQSPLYAKNTRAVSEHAPQLNPAIPANAQKMFRALTAKSRCLVTTDASTKEYAPMLTWKRKSVPVLPGIVATTAKLKIHA